MRKERLPDSAVLALVEAAVLLIVGAIVGAIEVIWLVWDHLVSK